MTLFESNLSSLRFLHRGKVRDIYAVGDDKLLVIQTDRLSAFDVILPDPIPGQVLTWRWVREFLIRQQGPALPNKGKFRHHLGEGEVVRARSLLGGLHHEYFVAAGLA